MSKFRLDEVDHQILDMLIDNTRLMGTLFIIFQKRKQMKKHQNRTSANYG